MPLTGVLKFLSKRAVRPPLRAFGWDSRKVAIFIAESLCLRTRRSIVFVVCIWMNAAKGFMMFPFMFCTSPMRSASSVVFETTSHLEIYSVRRSNRTAFNPFNYAVAACNIVQLRICFVALLRKAL